MTQKDLATWIREEHNEIDRLSTELSLKVAKVPRLVSEQWLKDVRGCFDSFAEHLRTHMKLEEQDGYMTAIVDRNPRMSERVERLGREHDDMRTLLDQMSALMSETTTGNLLLIRDFCHRVRNLIHYFEHHERTENDLVEYAFTQDIGTKD
ncbi:MAG: hemerythrin domain-containing protein [Phycisphaerae bacterium]